MQREEWEWKVVKDNESRVVVGYLNRQQEAVTH